MVSSKKLDIITNDGRIRTDVRNNQVHADALRTCTRNLGVDNAEAHGRQGRGDASKAVQGQDDIFEAPASCGSQCGEACQDRRRPFLDLWIRRDGHAACAGQRSAADRAKILP